MVAMERLDIASGREHSLAEGGETASIRRISLRIVFH